MTAIFKFNIICIDNKINYNSYNDNEYEPSPDTEKYKEWELKERFLNEMVELNKEVGDRGRKQK